MLKADGGTMSFEASIEVPGQTILSGPAASVMGALPFASDTGDTLVLDIGGTTTDMAVLVRRVPLLEPLGGEIGGHRTLIRSLKTKSIALGGDSVVRVHGRRAVDRPSTRMARRWPMEVRRQRRPTLFLSSEKRSNGDVDASRRGLHAIARNSELRSKRLPAEFLIYRAKRSFSPPVK